VWGGASSVVGLASLAGSALVAGVAVWLGRRGLTGSRP